MSEKAKETTDKILENDQSKNSVKDDGSINESTSKEGEVSTQELITPKGQNDSALEGFSKFMDDGGIFMWIILAMWAFGIAVALERIKSLLLYSTNGESMMKKVRNDVITNNVQKSIDELSQSRSLLAHTLRSALKRANSSKDVIKDALESSLLQSTPHVEKRLNYLALVANISTLVGLLGTIYGLIESFAAVAGADPAKKSELLALGISKAMNTTAFGLISAISIMIIHTLLTQKAEKIIGDLEQYSVKVLDLLNTRQSASTGLQKKSNKPNLKVAPTNSENGHDSEDQNNKEQAVV